VQAALTGHLVFSTLHTNDAPGALIRLNNMGVEPFLITSAVIGVVGQRLLRKVCGGCAEPEDPDPGLIYTLGITDDQVRRATFKRGRGCPKCGGRGYKGRAAAYEVMRMSDRMRDAVLTNAGGATLKEIAKADGMYTMREAGVRKALEGDTTLEEVARVLMSEEGGDGAVQLQQAA
jgi:type II secretory ATPase GspE/PulE/Tfp pilus assembly ATPase PilB-like protein